MTARLLVVDDEPDLEALVLQKFRRQIRDGAMDFLFAHDGIEALAMLKENADVDLVVTDINMPRMTACRCCRNCRKAKRMCRPSSCRAYGDMANIRTAMNRGAFDFVTKPIDFGDLEATITKTIRHIDVLRDTRERQAEAERAHASLSRYFSPNLAQRLASEEATAELAGQRREIATLFTDIAGFTALVETLEPSVLGSLLNEYLSEMTDIVFAHDGTVAKIVGDALHVLFGAPGEQPIMLPAPLPVPWTSTNSPRSSVRAGERKALLLASTRIGVGHAGSAIVGNSAAMASTTRLWESSTSPATGGCKQAAWYPHLRERHVGR